MRLPCGPEPLDLLFSNAIINIARKYGDGVPLITARAGLMTPADEEARREMLQEACGRFFYCLEGPSGPGRADMGKIDGFKNYQGDRHEAR
jgi:hypothetical protein